MAKDRTNAPGEEGAITTPDTPADASSPVVPAQEQVQIADVVTTPAPLPATDAISNISPSTDSVEAPKSDFDDEVEGERASDEAAIRHFLKNSSDIELARMAKYIREESDNRAGVVTPILSPETLTMSASNRIVAPEGYGPGSVFARDTVTGQTVWFTSLSWAQLGAQKGGWVPVNTIPPEVQELKNV